MVITYVVGIGMYLQDPYTRVAVVPVPLDKDVLDPHDVLNCVVTVGVGFPVPCAVGCADTDTADAAACRLRQKLKTSRFFLVAPAPT